MSFSWCGQYLQKVPVCLGRLCWVLLLWRRADLSLMTHDRLQARTTCWSWLLIFSLWLLYWTLLHLGVRLRFTVVLVVCSQECSHSPWVQNSVQRFTLITSGSLRQGYRHLLPPWSTTFMFWTSSRAEGMWWLCYWCCHGCPNHLWFGCVRVYPRAIKSKRTTKVGPPPATTAMKSTAAQRLYSLWILRSAEVWVCQCFGAWAQEKTISPSIFVAWHCFNFALEPYRMP